MTRRILSATAATAAFLLAGGSGAPASASSPGQRELERQFSGTVRPFLESYCLGCHNAEKQKGKLDLSAYTSLESVGRGYRQWETVSQKLKAEEMPPEEARRHPTPEQRRAVLDWIRQARAHESQRNAGDPGVVLPRRLSNAEYDYTVRDLTGVDLRPARLFPVDPANEAGFDNSGESLSMSPALLQKYLEAARLVADHLLLKPNGLAFAPHPVVTETDRDKYCVRRIVEFYQRQPADLAAYFMAAWRHRHRAALHHARASLADSAGAQNVSPQYLALLWPLLEEPAAPGSPIASLQTWWRALPPPGAEPQEAAQRACERMRDDVLALRQTFKPEFKNLGIRGIAPGSQPFVLWKDRQFAEYHMQSGAEDDAPTAPPGTGAHSGQAGRAPAEGKQYQADCRRFGRVFPDAFYISERGRVFLTQAEKEKEGDSDEKGRLLSAGFHLMTGYFRDDAPLRELILDEKGRRELDALWQELDFIALAPLRQYRDFVFFERAEPPRFMQGEEFDFARSEDKDVTSEAKMQRLAQAYLAKATRNGGEGAALAAIRDYFAQISADIRRVEQVQATAEAGHLQALLGLAERAFRRPLSRQDQDELLSFYRARRAQDGLGHEDAMRDTLVSVLVSPYFCFRADPSPPGPGIRPLSDYALASRLSYFLWSSLPDAELLAHARSGDLRVPRVLLAQARRMLRDDRVRGLAIEFGGNWLDFRRFEEHNSVDRERFKAFDNELRQAMFEEPIRFFLDLIRRDGSVLEFLYANHTLVNPVLARLYGMPAPGLGSNEWIRIDDAQSYGRGGLLPMAVFLTKNAPGLRTSPVKRGYWVIRRLLGEQVPPPPAKVPELPGDEGQLGDRTLRDLLARHRADKSCAACHDRFDALGLVFEGYGPIGERRVCDLGGRPVDVQATFPNGSKGAGLAGLRGYLREYRQQEFIDNLCGKLLAYALGRTLVLSDDTTLEELRARLRRSGYRWPSLVEGIVTSRQFLTQRGQDNNEP